MIRLDCEASFDFEDLYIDYLIPCLSPVVNTPVVQPTSSFNEFAKAMYSLMQGGEWAQDQFVTTRGGKESTTSAGQGF